MQDRVPRWQRRTRRVLLTTEWAALALGIMADVINSEGSTTAVVAAASGGVWVLLATVIPPGQWDKPYRTELVALAGAVSTMIAVTLTGAAGSPYLLLAITPAMHVTLLGGVRTGIGTGLLSTGMLIVVALSQGQDLTAAAVPATLMTVVTVVVAQIRRILVEIETRAQALETESQRSAARLAELEHTRELLDHLANATASGELGIPALGRAALDALTRRFPDMHGNVAVLTPGGPVIVATTGSHAEHRGVTHVPLVTAGQTVGTVTIETEQDIDGESLADVLNPVAMAISNSLRLQELAGRAVSEERTRLARELHDEIGPSLASLGLSLDVAMIEAGDRAPLVEHLGQLRDTVARLVEEVRTTVADLREQESASLIRRLELLAADLPAQPPTLVTVDERRPARPSLAPQIHAIVTESVRNAVRHAGASKVTVHGWLDYDRGRVVVEDDGIGFDPAELPEGHFGVIGMRERAASAGIDLDLSTGPEGTRIVVEWGSP